MDYYTISMYAGINPTPIYNHKILSSSPKQARKEAEKRYALNRHASIVVLEYSFFGKEIREVCQGIIDGNYMWIKE